MVQIPAGHAPWCTHCRCFCAHIASGDAHSAAAAGAVCAMPVTMTAARGSWYACLLAWTAAKQRAARRRVGPELCHGWIMRLAHSGRAQLAQRCQGPAAACGLVCVFHTSTPLCACCISLDLHQPRQQQRVTVRASRCPSRCAEHICLQTHLNWQGVPLGGVPGVACFLCVWGLPDGGPLTRGDPALSRRPAASQVLPQGAVPASSWAAWLVFPGGPDIWSAPAYHVRPKRRLVTVQSPPCSRCYGRGLPLPAPQVACSRCWSALAVACKPQTRRGAKWARSRALQRKAGRGATWSGIASRCRWQESRLRAVRAPLLPQRRRSAASAGASSIPTPVKSRDARRR